MCCAHLASSFVRIGNASKATRSTCTHLHCHTVGRIIKVGINNDFLKFTMIVIERFSFAFIFTIRQSTKFKWGSLVEWMNEWMFKTNGLEARYESGNKVCKTTEKNENSKHRHQINNIVHIVQWKLIRCLSVWDLLSEAHQVDSLVNDSFLNDFNYKLWHEVVEMCEAIEEMKKKKTVLIKYLCFFFKKRCYTLVHGSKEKKRNGTDNGNHISPEEALSLFWKNSCLVVVFLTTSPYALPLFKAPQTLNMLEHKFLM